MAGARGVQVVDGRSPTPLFGPAGLALAFLLALIASWPMLALQGPLVFFDTVQYYDRGGKLIAMVFGSQEVAAPVGDAGGATAGGQGEPGLTGIRIRSLPYALYTYLSANTPLGLYFTCLVQGAIAIWVFFALVPAAALRRSWWLWTGFALMVVFTALPWFVSYAMPDILGAILPVYYIILLRRIDRMAAWQRWVLALLATAAIAVHYGNQPLAAVLAVVVLAWRGFEGRFGWRIALMAIGPVVAVLSFNFAVGAATSDQPTAKSFSAAPKRLPILLARSIEDGPARWYLDDACPQAGYAMCEIFDPMPENITAFLWEQGGYAGASDAQIARINEEENAILWEAFKRYPIQQTRALVRNAGLQAVKVGLDDMWTLTRPADAFPGDEIEPVDAEREKPGQLLMFDRIVSVATLVAVLLVLAGMATGRIGPLGREAFVLLAVALAVNAAVFGGLSAPVDRYQGRLAWLIPAMLVLYTAPGLGVRTRYGTPQGRP
ncbi:MAG: hypothetical protein WA936_10085 [Erythrobacter sp.]